MMSMLVISILLQQYLFRPRESSTFLGSSPFFTLLVKSPYLSATKLPHVKHLTGIIIAFLPPFSHLYDFCFLRRGPGPPNFLVSGCLGSPESRWTSYSVIFLLNSCPLVQSASALEMAIAAASAWPIKPPPKTRTLMSTLSRNSPASTSGVNILCLATVGVKISAGTLFILTLPVPCIMAAVARACLRDPE